MLEPETGCGEKKSEIEALQSEKGEREVIEDYEIFDTDIFRFLLLHFRFDFEFFCRYW